MNRQWTLRVEWKPQDLWIGMFWKKLKDHIGTMRIDVWICLLPMLPIHFQWNATDEQKADQWDRYYNQPGH